MKPTNQNKNNQFISPKQSIQSNSSPKRPNQSQLQMSGNLTSMLNTSRQQQSPGFGNISKCSPIQQSSQTRRFSQNLFGQLTSARSPQGQGQQLISVNSSSHQFQPSSQHSNLNNTYHQHQKKDNLFFVEQVRFHCGDPIGTDKNQRNASRLQTNGGGRMTASTALSTTLQFSTPTPEPYHYQNKAQMMINNKINNSTANTSQVQNSLEHSRLSFKKDILQMENQLQDRARTSMGILKEQQYQRGLQDQPLVKGARNQQYQSPSLTSNEVFYVDYRGNPKPNIFRSQSSQSSPEKQLRRASACSAQSSQRIVETCTQFLLQQESATVKNHFAKKISHNMKNYSSLSIGENDNLREMYERSASRNSNRSMGNQLLENSLAIQNSQDQTNQQFSETQKVVLNPLISKVGGLSSPRILNEKLGYKRPREPIVKSIKEVLQFGDLTQQIATVSKPLGNEQKVQWPSKDQNKKPKGPQPFNKHQKLIPDSQPKKHMLLNLSTTQQITMPKSILTAQNQNTYIQQKQENAVQESQSIADAFSGDHFKYIHEERERSRQTQRDLIFNKFYKDRPNSQLLTDRPSISQKRGSLSGSCNNQLVSLQVGRDDSYERKIALQYHSQFLQGQIQKKRDKNEKESSRQMEDGIKFQEQLRVFNQWKDKEEANRKQRQQDEIATGLEKILNEKRTESQNRQLQSLKDQENMRQAAQIDRILKEKQDCIRKIQSNQLKDQLQKQIVHQTQKKQDDMSENGQIFKVKVMNNVHPFKRPS